MNFRDKYKKEKTWHRKVMVMEIFHLAMKASEKKHWTITDTARYFKVSTGLVSENLKLARAIYNDFTLISCDSRQDALEIIR